jgi:hypothetical protein
LTENIPERLGQAFEALIRLERHTSSRSRPGNLPVGSVKLQPTQAAGVAAEAYGRPGFAVREEKTVISQHCSVGTFVIGEPDHRIIGIRAYSRASEGRRANCDSCATVAIEDNDLFSFDSLGCAGSAHQQECGHAKHDSQASHFQLPILSFKPFDALDQTVGLRSHKPPSIKA